MDNEFITFAIHFVYQKILNYSMGFKKNSRKGAAFGGQLPV